MWKHGLVNDIVKTWHLHKHARYFFFWSLLQCLLLELLGLLCAVLASCPAIPSLPFCRFSLFGFPVMAMLAQWQTWPLLHPLVLLECKSQWQRWKYNTSWWVWYKCLQWISTSGHYSLWNQKNIFKCTRDCKTPEQIYCHDMPGAVFCTELEWTTAVEFVSHL